MPALIELNGSHSACDNLELLQGYLQTLVGQPFLHFRFSYGDEFVLHFGEPRSYASPRLKRLVKGSFILAARASQWYLRPAQANGVVIGSFETGDPATEGFLAVDPLALEKSSGVGADAKVVFARAFPIRVAATAWGSIGLSLLLSDGTSLLLNPDAADESKLGDDDIADWELFTPFDRYLRVGPGLHWSYLPSRNATT